MALKKKLGTRRPAAAKAATKKAPARKSAPPKVAATKAAPAKRKSKALNASDVVNPFDKGTPRHAVAALLLKRGEHSWEELKEAAGGTLSPRSMGAVLVALEAAGGRFKKTKTEEYGVVYQYDKTASLIGNHTGAEATGVADEIRQASRNKTLAAKKAATTKKAPARKSSAKKAPVKKAPATKKAATKAAPAKAKKTAKRARR